MGSDAKNSMSDRSVQIAKTNEVIGAMQLTEGELIAEIDGRTEGTVVARAGWLRVVADGIAKYTQYGNNDTLPVSDGAIAIDIVQSEGGIINLSTFTTVNSRHPEGKSSVDKGYACGLLLENGGNLCVLEGHRVKKIIFDQESGLLVNGIASAVVVDGGGELLVYPGEEASSCGINQGGVFILAGKANDTLFTGDTMSNLGDEDSDIIAEDGSAYRLGTDGLQLHSSGETQDLSVNVGGRVEVHADTLESMVIQGKTVILLPSTSADESFVVEEDRAPAELTGSVVLLDSASIIIGYGADLQQSTITVQRGNVLILDGSMVKGDGVIFSVGSTNLNGGELWLITGTATHMQLKVKRLRGEGTICLRTSMGEISPDFINVKGEVIGGMNVEITDAGRQILCDTLKSQSDEDGTGTRLQPA